MTKLLSLGLMALCYSPHFDLGLAMPMTPRPLHSPPDNYGGSGSIDIGAQLGTKTATTASRIDSNVIMRSDTGDDGTNQSGSATAKCSTSLVSKIADDNPCPGHVALV